MPARYGLIGYPLTHSFSPAYFAKKFREAHINATYDGFELKEVSVFPSLLQAHPDLRGLNVTIPYKAAIIPYLHELSEEAKEIGAVNCIDIRAGKLKGYNTDAAGFEKSLLPLLKPVHTKALVLGTGGSSRAVKCVLKKSGIEFLSVSRTKKEEQVTYEELSEEIIRAYSLIINTTPLGMYPAVTLHPPIPYDALTAAHLLYDLIYNPAETMFLALGRAKGAITKSGLEMLQLQAEESWKIWSEPKFIEL